MELTRRQLEIVTFVSDFRRRHAIAPTLDEIAERIGVSRVTVHQHLQALQDKGALRRAPRRARALRLTARMERALEAAQPWSVRRVTAELSSARLAPASSPPLDVAEMLQLGRARSLVRLKGDVPGWREGDYLLLDPRRAPREGETVLAVAAGGAPVLGRVAGGELRPERGAALRLEQVEVRGVVVGAIRRVPAAG